MKRLSRYLHGTRIAANGRARTGKPGALNVEVDLPSGADLGLVAGSRALYVAVAAPDLDAAFSHDGQIVDRLCSRGAYPKLVLDLRLVESAGARGLGCLARIRRIVEDRRMALLVRSSRSLGLTLAAAAWPTAELDVGRGSPTSAPSVAEPSVDSPPSLDMPDLRGAQAALIEAEKMESLSRLAAGVAHEIKNPLSQIVLAVDYLVGALQPQGGTLAEVVQMIRDAAARIDRIVIGMLDFSTPVELGMGPCDLNEILDNVLRLSEGIFQKQGIVLERRLGESLPQVLADSGRLEHVFLNLVKNAIQAMPHGGTLSVSTLSKHFAASERDVGQKHGWFRAGDVAVVAQVADTGHGIPEDKLDRIFEPFFTTKETGQGTGLGLSVTKKIIELHRGRLMIRNRPEGGVMASVMLNTAADPSRISTAHEPANPAA